MKSLEIQENKISSKYKSAIITKNGTAGITLIALVITIIVILILAGVSISMISGNNGILTKVGQASEKQKDAVEDEEVKMAVMTARASDSLGKLTDTNLRNAISNTFGSDNGLIGTGPWTYIGERKTYEIDGDGDTTSSKNEKVEEVADTNPGDIKTDSKGDSVTGTESDPYQICSIEDLIAFSDIVNAGQITSTDTYVDLAQTLNFRSTKSYIDSSRTSLTTTLLDGSTQTHTYTTSIMSDLTSGVGFTPIGGDDGFAGTFDGKGNTLNNLYINYVEETCDYANVGLFTTNNGIIQNLTVGGNVTGITENTWCIGTISGENYGSINNCNSKAIVMGLGVDLYTGGIVGYNEGNIVNSSNTGSITNKSNNQIYLSDLTEIAGIVGDSSGGTIENCFNSGKISTINLYRVYTGGIVGCNEDTTISKCYNTGNITANNIVNFIKIGGIVGQNYTDVDNCYNIGTISTTNSNGVLKGGIIAYNRFEGSVANNYDGTNIGAIGGQDFIGVGESATLTVSSIVDYINAGTHPDSKTPTYAIDNKLTPGSYVAYDTSSLSDYQIPQSLSGTSSYTELQTVQPSQYTGGWQVLSNDGNKVEIISSDVVTIANSYSGSVQNCIYLYGETGYKNAVKTLNTSANAFVNSNYAESARCAGSTSSSLETVTDTLKYMPTNYKQLTDMEFYKDYANMCYSGTATATSGDWYWLPSRKCSCDSDESCFSSSGCGGTGHRNRSILFFIYPDGTTYSNYDNYGLRSIVSLKSNLKVLSGTGTAEEPYVLGTN